MICKICKTHRVFSDRIRMLENEDEYQEPCPNCCQWVESEEIHDVNLLEERE